METEKYRALVARAQTAMEQRNLGGALFEQAKPALGKIFPPGALFVQQLRLRAVRPNVDVWQESLGWHRESFYAFNFAGVNLWMPISGVCDDSALQYIAGSHAIPDADIKLEVYQDDTMPKGGNTIGMVHAEKRIVSGVDLSNPQPLVVLPGEMAIFDGALIHGSGKNRTNEIRFSVDFRAEPHRELPQ